MSLSKNIYPSLELVQPRKTRPFIIERLLMGRKKSKQTNKQTNKQKGDCRGSSESTHVKMSKYWKSHAAAHLEVTVV